MSTSAISVPSSPASATTPTAKRHIRPRKNFSKSVIGVLKEWMIAHKDHPYPSDHEKAQLCQATGLSKKQLRIWFTNARKRLRPQLLSETSADSPMQTPGLYHPVAVPSLPLASPGVELTALLAEQYCLCDLSTLPPLPVGFAVSPYGF